MIAGLASDGFARAIAGVMLLLFRPLLLPITSNSPENRLPPDFVIVFTTAPVKPPYSAGAPRPWI